ncbi:MAG: hypothetical protein IKV45_04600 [Firmicutes bacterium]|nr:hypothetical protein [Bacillota bacterium]
MNIQQIINFADSIKPNAFSNEDKVMWLNEVEGVVQTDVLLRRPEEIVTYYYESTSEVDSIRISDDATMVLSQPVAVHPGGYVDLTDDAGNRIFGATLLAVEGNGTVLRFAPGTFPQTGSPFNGYRILRFYGDQTELLAPAPFQKIYYTYLMAMMDFANGEFGKYQNTIQLFNSYLTCYSRWACAGE